MTTTYYDSQSGQHVPIHDESKITAYLHVQAGRDVSLEHTWVNDANDLGMAGTLLTLAHRQLLHDSDHAEEDDDDNDDNVDDMIQLLKSIDKISNVGELFLGLSPSVQPSQVKQLLHNNNIIPDNCNLCFEFDNNDNSADSSSISENILASTSQHGTATSIGIFNPKYYTDEDPISVASQVATLIDATAEQGGSISKILLAPTPTVLDDADDMVRLCEELTYLDVPGPTIKSRLIVSSASLGDDVDELIEECMNMGISKFILNHDAAGNVNDTLGMIRDVVEEQGKELVLLNR